MIKPLRNLTLLLVFTGAPYITQLTIFCKRRTEDNFVYSLDISINDVRTFAFEENYPRLGLGIGFVLKLNLGLGERGNFPQGKLSQKNALLFPRFVTVSFYA